MEGVIWPEDKLMKRRSEEKGSLVIGGEAGLHAVPERVNTSFTQVIQ